MCSPLSCQLTTLALTLAAVAFSAAGHAEDSLFDQPPLMQDPDFDSSSMPLVPTSTGIEYSGGLHSTAIDLLRWIGWHVDDKRSSTRIETRLTNHTAFPSRDRLESVVRLDDGTLMDAMSVGWVIMLPEGNRPLILQKSVGLQGTFPFVTIAPARGVGAFFVLNEFNAGGLLAEATARNDFGGELAPR